MVNPGSPVEGQPPTRQAARKGSVTGKRGEAGFLSSRRRHRHNPQAPPQPTAPSAPSSSLPAVKMRFRTINKNETDATAQFLASWKGR